MAKRPWGREEEEDVEVDGFRPATGVSWDAARRFCVELTRREQNSGRLSAGARYRLPTEAEWEFACRAGSEGRFSFGDRDSLLGRYAWYYANAGSSGEAYPHQVGLLRANDWQVHDMHGNVWEWTSDAYATDLPGGVDPSISEGDQRVFRGGAFGSFATDCRSAARLRQSSGFAADNLGFRVVLAPSDDSSLPPEPDDGGSANPPGGVSPAPTLDDAERDRCEPSLAAPDCGKGHAQKAPRWLRAGAPGRHDGSGCFPRGK